MEQRSECGKVWSEVETWKEGERSEGRVMWGILCECVCVGQHECQYVVTIAKCMFFVVRDRHLVCQCGNGRGTFIFRCVSMWTVEARVFPVERQFGECLESLRSVCFWFASV